MTLKNNLLESEKNITFMLLLLFSNQYILPQLYFSKIKRCKLWKTSNVQWVDGGRETNNSYFPYFLLDRGSCLSLFSCLIIGSLTAEQDQRAAWVLLWQRALQCTGVCSIICRRLTLPSPERAQISPHSDTWMPDGCFSQWCIPAAIDLQQGFPKRPTLICSKKDCINLLFFSFLKCWQCNPFTVILPCFWSFLVYLSWLIWSLFWSFKFTSGKTCF